MKNNDDDDDHAGVEFNNNHTWHSNTDWLQDQRHHKATLTAKGIQGYRLQEEMASLNLEHKMAIFAATRCPKCWHTSAAAAAVDVQHDDGDNKIIGPTLCSASRCICDRLEALAMRVTNNGTDSDGHHHGGTTTTTTTPTHNNVSWNIPNNVKLLILMHHKEFLCAGNSAKLLFQLLPDLTELFLYGKLGEVDRLFREMVGDGDVSYNRDNENDINGMDPLRHTMILWPSPEACSLADFLVQTGNERNDKKPSYDDNGDNKHSNSTSNHSPFLRIVVLDGTYTQARNMRKSLRKRIRSGSHNANTCLRRMPLDVALRPTVDSVFHRAQKNYGKAHQQRRGAPQRRQKHQKQGDESSCHEAVLSGTNSDDDVPRRICTAEACGLLLTELGAEASVLDQIVQAVMINNEAMAFARCSSADENNEVKDGET